jgi:lysozyme
MIGYGHKINKEEVVVTTKTEIKAEDTKITMDTKDLPPFGEGRAESIPEIIKWAGKTATQLLDVTRGCGGTFPQLHKKGSKFTFAGEDYSLGITKKQADLLFDNDIKISIDLVRKNVKVDINQNQSNALISLARNLGPAAFAASTVLSALNKGNFAQATTEFMRYASKMEKVPFTLNGIESIRSQLSLNSGLFSRRLREATLFSTPASELLRRAVRTSITAWDPTGCGTYAGPRTPETWVNPNTGLPATPGSTWINPNTGLPTVAQHGTTTSGITGVSLASADQSLYSSYQNELPTSTSGYYRSTGSPSLVEQAYTQWDSMTPAQQAAASKAAQDRRKKAEENR